MAQQDDNGPLVRKPDFADAPQKVHGLDRCTVWTIFLLQHENNEVRYAKFVLEFRVVDHICGINRRFDDVLNRKSAFSVCPNVG